MMIFLDLLELRKRRNLMMVDGGARLGEMRGRESRAGCPFAKTVKEGRTRAITRRERHCLRWEPCAILPPPSHADGTTNGLINVPNFLGDGLYEWPSQPPGLPPRHAAAAASAGLLPPSLPPSSSVYGSIRKCRKDTLIMVYKRHLIRDTS